MLTNEELEILAKAKLISEKQKQLEEELQEDLIEKEKKTMYDNALAKLNEERNTYLSQLQNIDELVETCKQQLIANLHDKIATIATKIDEMGTFNGQCLHRKTAICKTAIKYSTSTCFEAFDGTLDIKYCTTCGKHICGV